MSMTPARRRPAARCGAGRGHHRLVPLARQDCRRPSLIGILILFHWLERDGLKDNTTATSACSTHLLHHDQRDHHGLRRHRGPVTERTRLFDALIVDPNLFLLFFIGTAYLFVARRTWEKFIMKRIQRSLRDHIVRSRLGTKNSRPVQLIDLVRLGKACVVIDQIEDRLLCQGHRKHQRAIDAVAAEGAGSRFRRYRASSGGTLVIISGWAGRYLHPGLPDRPASWPIARISQRSISRTMRAAGTSGGRCRRQSAGFRFGLADHPRRPSYRRLSGRPCHDGRSSSPGRARRADR